MGQDASNPFGALATANPPIAEAVAEVVQNQSSSLTIPEVTPITTPLTTPITTPLTIPDVSPPVTLQEELNAQITSCRASLAIVTNNLARVQEENIALSAEETVNSLRQQLTQQEELLANTMARDTATIQESQKKITLIEEQLTKINKSLQDADAKNNKLMSSLKLSEESLIDEQADDKKYKMVIIATIVCLCIFIGLTFYFKSKASSIGGSDGYPQQLPMIGGSMSSAGFSWF